MQPQDTNPQADFDFMLKQEPARKRSGLTSMGRPAKILAGAVVLLIAVTVAALLLGRGNTSSQQMVDLMAQSQEIIRVSQLQDQQFEDSNTQGLAATTVVTMQSQQSQFGEFLSRTNVKYSEEELALRTNTSTDAQLETAAQNNMLDDTYNSYLKKALGTYYQSLVETYQSTQSNTLRETLQAAYTSIDTLLQSPQLKST